MPMYTGVDPRLRGQLEADVRQLVDPIVMAVRGRIVKHPSLLDQLRAAVEPGAVPQYGRRLLRRRVDSRLPINVGATDALATIYGELMEWADRLSLSAPVVTYDFPGGITVTVRRVDRAEYTLRRLPDKMPDLAPGVAEWLALDVRAWWRLAATQSGWRTDELVRLR